ncbi:NAD-dependent epimerase/dehydratase family protein [uncultured Succinatimonas sp.]|uniref:NAD-dependent epimerase/dehydratase family protein n=1 Tax=uncultured Succinatimonas sp. TaxID=1262973 RepID=UPI0025F7CAAA|nr:NAD-dependent epimerase/dehydratase family protein [uncultured Succinatimonas sp.]
MKVLVTGSAGFIGAALVKALLNKEHEVVGIDNINSYYDQNLKYARLSDAGIETNAINEGKLTESKKTPLYRFMKMDLTDRSSMNSLFVKEKFDIVINLAGQAGVRYSVENPFAYVESNIYGFLNILENCRHHPVKHLIYASSSSIYGMSDHIPYKEEDKTDKPVSLYAATKKADELMAYSYSKLYGIPATGLRFFTVYGPWGRPDMAPFLFMKSILEGKPIHVFNHGNMQRDFTYIDDVICGILLLLEHPANEAVPHQIYNIGHSSPVALMDFIETIEKETGRKAILKMENMQPGDVCCTYADISRLQHDFSFNPQISIEQGIHAFYEWYMNYIRSKNTALIRISSRKDQSNFTIKNKMISVF